LLKLTFWQFFPAVDPLGDCCSFGFLFHHIFSSFRLPPLRFCFRFSLIVTLYGGFFVGRFRTHLRRWFIFMCFCDASFMFSVFFFPHLHIDIVRGPLTPCFHLHPFCPCASPFLSCVFSPYFFLAGDDLVICILTPSALLLFLFFFWFCSCSRRQRVSIETLADRLEFIRLVTEFCLQCKVHLYLSLCSPLGVVPFAVSVLFGSSFFLFGFPPVYCLCTDFSFFP